MSKGQDLISSKFQIKSVLPEKNGLSTPPNGWYTYSKKKEIREWLGHLSMWCRFGWPNQDHYLLHWKREEEELLVELGEMETCEFNVWCLTIFACPLVLFYMMQHLRPLKEVTVSSPEAVGWLLKKLRMREFWHGLNGSLSKSSNHLEELDW